MHKVSMIIAALVLGTTLVAGDAALAAGGGGGGSSSSGSAPTRSPGYNDHFVAVETMQISLIQTAQVRGTLVVSFGLDVLDEHLRQEAEHAMPRLRDAYIHRLARYGATRVDVTRVPDANQIAELLQLTTDQVLGTEGADVLMMNVLVRSGLHRRGALGH